MRVLVATTAGGGHFGPLVPFADALRVAGHEVLVAAPESFAASVKRAGFEFAPFADVPPEDLQAVFGRLSGLSPEEANAIVVGEVFARLDSTYALPGTKAIVDEWRPDLILRESTEYSSYIVAEESGVPHVHMAIGLASFGSTFLPVVEGPLVELGAAPGLESLRDAPTMTLLPASLEDPGVPGRPDIRRFREHAGEKLGLASPPEDLPRDWWPEHAADEPLVYVTFGSVAAGMGFFPDFYRAVIEAIAEVPVRVLFTLGDAGDPSLLEPLPANVHVENWFPQKTVMARASAMVGHGGVGTTLMGLAAGMPQVVFPLFADQPYNARRVEAIGAGVMLAGGPAAVSRLGEALRRVLDDASISDGAQRIAAEIRSLPPVSGSVPFMEEIAATR